MKKPLLIAAALLISVALFGQKKEIKKAQKAFVKGDVEKAKTFLSEAEVKLGEADLSTQIDFYVATGEITLADAGKTDYNKMKEAAAAFMKAQELDTEKSYESMIANGKDNVRVALFNSAVTDSQAKNFSKAGEKFYLSYQVKQDTLDLYYAAGSMLNAKNYDLSLDYYQQLLEMDYTGIKKEYVALRIEDGKTVPFASEADRNSEMISGKFTKPGERMSESAKGDILKNVVLMLSSKGENEKAITLMKEARAENPTDLSLIRAEAEMVYKMGDMDRYNELMIEVLASDPDNPEVYYNIGVATAANGDKAKAIEYYKKAIALKPDYPSAQVNLGALILSDEVKIVDEMNSLGMSKADGKRYDELEAKREGLYREALPYLESAYASRGDNQQLIRKLMDIYSQLSMDDKFAEMKAKLSALDGN
jgi:tetratricopeptide (TPR) repeat protein